MVALLLGVVLLVAAADASAETPPRRSLTGRLLVATEAMRDPRFARTVIYMVRHTEKGAFGLIVNLPMAEVPFERALRPFGLEVPPDAGDVRVHYGGPVDERRGFVLHTPDWTGERTTVVDGSFALTEDPAVLQAMARGTGPRRALFFLGHAGWAPGQLDAELATGAWAIARADERLVFDEDSTQKWIDAMTRRLLDL
ncbi:MAG TPA: YqgE/AlgH family protein [Methylomirabilota bacterium]